MACEGKTKGKVIYVDNGQKYQIEVPFAPFTVTCSAVGACGKPGIRSFDFTTQRGDAACNGSFDFQTFQNETFYFKTSPNANGLGGVQQNLYASCNGVERLIYNAFSIACGTVYPNNVAFLPDKTYGFSIKNSITNAVLLNKIVSECNYEIVCDDDCPPGHIKCTHNKYPGYCCVPCKQVGDRLKNMANKVGR